MECGRPIGFSGGKGLPLRASVLPTIELTTVRTGVGGQSCLRAGNLAGFWGGTRKAAHRAVILVADG